LTFKHLLLNPLNETTDEIRELRSSESDDAVAARKKKNGIHSSFL